MYSLHPFNRTHPVSYSIDATTTIPLKRSSTISRREILSRVILKDDSKDYSDSTLVKNYTELEPSDTTTTVRDSNDHLCNITQFTYGLCLPYTSIELQTNTKVTTILRKYPTILEVMGDVGGTCEIIMIFSSTVYLLFLFLHRLKNSKKELRDMYGITEEQKLKYKEITGKPFDEKKFQKISSIKLQQYQEGTEILKAIALVNLMSKKVFNEDEQKILPLAMADESLVLSSRSKEFLDGIPKNVNSDTESSLKPAQ